MHPRRDDITTLLDLMTAADDVYQHLIAEHITHAEHVLDEHTAHHRYQPIPGQSLLSRESPGWIVHRREITTVK
jgi:hypothetical protein